MTSVHLARNVCAGSAPCGPRLSARDSSNRILLGGRAGRHGIRRGGRRHRRGLGTRRRESGYEQCGPASDLHDRTCWQCDGLYAVLELNHRTLPDYTPGGLQLQLWNGDEPIDVQEIFRTTDCSGITPETIRWTQRMQLEDGQLTFEVVDGSSDSWNRFGGQGYLNHVCHTSLDESQSVRPKHLE